MLFSKWIAVTSNFQSRQNRPEPLFHIDVRIVPDVVDDLENLSAGVREPGGVFSRDGIAAVTPNSQALEESGVPRDAFGVVKQGRLSVSA